VPLKSEPCSGPAGSCRRRGVQRTALRNRRSTLGDTLGDQVKVFGYLTSVTFPAVNVIFISG
jgi:hypothetical protein